MRDQVNAYGAAQGFKQKGSNANEYTDLPNPKRAQEIVAEAKRRLADMNGKPSQLQGMISKVTDEYYQKDQAIKNGDGLKGQYEQPNNMDAYIDKVLGMSGMTEAPDGDQAADVPIPDERPANQSGGVPASVDAPASVDGVMTDAPPQDGVMTDAANAGNQMGSIAQIAAGVLGVGGAALLGKYLYSKFGNKANGAVVTTDAPNLSKTTADASGVDKSIASIEADDKQARLPAGNEQLMLPDESRYGGLKNAQGQDVPLNKDGWPEGTESWAEPKSPVDAGIDATMSEGEDANAQAGVEGRDTSYQRPIGPRPTGADTGNAAQRNAVLEEGLAMVKSGDIRGAVNLWRENGIELGDDMMRALAEQSNTFKSMRQRVGNVAGAAARNAAR